MGNGENLSPQKENERVVWKPPKREYIKINVDASFVESLRSASIGVVARNHLGEVPMSSWDFIRMCSGVEEAELPACLAGAVHWYFSSQTNYLGN